MDVGFSEPGVVEVDFGVVDVGVVELLVGVGGVDVGVVEVLVGVVEVVVGVVEVLVGVVEVDFGVVDFSEDCEVAAPPAPRTEPLESPGTGLTSR